MTARQLRTIEAFRHRSYYHGMEGLGVTQQQAAATVGSSLLSASRFAGPAAPFLAIGGAIADIVSLFGPNPNNEYATEIVNRIQNDVMTPNLQAWQALSADQKTISAQAVALQNFQNGWNYVVNACTNPQLGSAGINCIADRDRGACKWKDANGNCWNWWTGYHDPIANDPAVRPDPIAPTDGTGTGASGTVTGTSGGGFISSSSTLLFGLGIIVVALFLGGD